MSLKKFFSNSFLDNFTEIINLLIGLIYEFVYKTNIFINKKIFFIKLERIFKDKPIKFIIRNDRLGDSILTLPFILGSKSKEKFYIKSDYIGLILKELKLDDNWFDLKKMPPRNCYLGANLSGYNFENIEEIKDSKKYFIFTQVGLRNSPKKGYPILYSPNYASNKSQTNYVKNAFDILKINFSAEEGIKVLNRTIDNLSKDKYSKFKNSIIVFLGIGLDPGRKIDTNTIYKIRDYCNKNKLKLYIQEEPNFKKFFNDFSKKYDIKLINGTKISELFFIFRKAKLVIGFDCGPMHLASLCTQTLVFFSHTSRKQWGHHIWNKKLYLNKLNFNSIEYTLIKNINLGSKKYNWIFYKRNIRCPIHNDKRFKKIIESKNCCNLNLDNIDKILELMNI